MRPLLLAGGLLVLSGCALILPRPDPNRAWIDLDTNGESDLAALEVDGKPWRSSRYFEVDPGQHELRVRFQFQVAASDIGATDAVNEGLWRDCQLTLKYKDFNAGQRYRLQTGNIGFYPWAKLYDAEAKEVARGRTGRCEKV
ncbi:PA0061/PA0062 family lipoprotein [Pseudomonas panipatensis]|jgi:hypothetical protein|uniref:Lipoprotein n=1 Tax=Pseudomonas panipatensis TaxID=428992 RepID=A0A1G8LT02_9PSED|nr:hypothetical protein [Pseudomonas panipatensis]SDI58766.1 hypothetical protein SAMN05216272_11270 [Pseudomonas panipatensis]SMP46960.1 hypothetical protein SAMN06295951_10270 [Pseudomonas panipatensis]